MRLLLSVLLLCATLPAAVAQTLYKSVGPDGSVRYSDRPPADGQAHKTLRFDNLPGSAVPAATLSYMEQLRRFRQSAPAPAAVPQATPVLFSAVWCGYCKLAKAHLAARQVAYQEIDIDTPAGKLTFAQAGGGRSVPLLLANGQRVQGFSATAYDAALGRRAAQ